MTSGPSTNGGEQNLVDTEREFEATIATALDISPYDLEALKRDLLSVK
jgi:hypothetical protein